uniref:Protein zyg-11 homolog B-like n=2 Tax=Hirondellea gigas TaxID=1518452 RepID=A0A6A7FX02_9CRUS
MRGAMWPGDSKWEVTSTGSLEPASLKKLTLCYICEHLGTLCNIVPAAPRTFCYRMPPDHKIQSTNNAEELRIDLEKLSKSSNESDLDKFKSNVTENSSIDELVIPINVGSDTKSDSLIIRFKNPDPWDERNLIPYSAFDVPNYGKVYEKSNSADPPADDSKLQDIFSKNKFNFKFRFPVYLSPHTAAMLLEELDRCGMLNDSVLSLFNNSQILLYEVNIHRCGEHITGEGLRFLRHNNLHKLSLHFLNNVAPGTIARSLNTWTRRNLAVLSLQHFNPPTPIPHAVLPENQLCMLTGQLPFLLELDLCRNEYLGTDELSFILKCLPVLRKLDISNCCLIYTLEPLLQVSFQLRHLNISNLRLQNVCVAVTVLRTLVKLRYFDCRHVSFGDETEQKFHEMLTEPTFAPDLEVLDVAFHLQLSQEVLTKFLSTHPKIRFVGLIIVPLCADFNTSKWPSVKFLREIGPVGDTGLVNTLSDCLTHYKNSSGLVSSILQQINSISAIANTPQPILVANILRMMELHQKLTHVQVAGTACLYNLTTGSLGPAINPLLLRSVVHVTIHAMNSHISQQFEPPNVESRPLFQQLQKNGFQLLCCDQVLHNVSFNQYWVARMALHALHGFNDESIDLMAVGICSILAAKLTNEQTASLGSNLFMTKLLMLVENRINTCNADITLQFTLSALWNLTDESPNTCGIFITREGLKVLIKLLNSFPDNTSVETKVLGLINNVAEVPMLRIELLRSPIVSLLREQLKSEHIAVSYFAAGISAHLLCADKDAWAVRKNLPYQELREELGEAVMSWESPKDEMVAYKSFHPFLPLLHYSDCPQVQLWALWALHHVTVKNSKYYCPMLIREEIPSLLERLYEESSSSAAYVSEFAGMLLELVRQYKLEQCDVDAATVTLVWQSKRQRQRKQQ